MFLPTIKRRLGSYAHTKALFLEKGYKLTLNVLIDCLLTTSVGRTVYDANIKELQSTHSEVKQYQCINVRRFFLEKDYLTTHQRMLGKHTDLYNVISFLFSINI